MYLIVHSTGCTDGSLRLTGGSSNTEGTVEVCFDQTWRVVSSSGWGLEDAQVVCRQLGHQTEGKRVECNKLTACTHGAHCSGVEFYTNSSFGKPNRSVLLTEVQCSGSEVNLINCSSNELSYENGSELIMQADVAGVSCNFLSSILPSTTQMPPTVMPAVCPTTQCPDPTMPTDCPTTQCLHTTLNLETLAALCSTAKFPDRLQATNSMAANSITSIISSNTQTPSTQPSTGMPAVCPTTECPVSTMHPDCPTTQCPDPTMPPDCPTTQCPVQITSADCPTITTVNPETLAALCPTPQFPDRLQASNSMAAELGNTVQALYALAVVAAVLVVLSAIFGIR